MKNYRKKPVVIQAIQFFDQPEELINIQEFMGDIDLTIDYKDINDPKLKIETLEGVMNASLGDWIIKGINGEFYPCKPDIFERTYESAYAPESFLDRVKQEKEELEVKLQKLNDFIENNPKFKELSNINRILLVNQFNAMELYYYALDSRIEYIND